MKDNSNAHHIIDRLANALRIYGEERYKAKKLFLVDSIEATDNLDQAFRGILEAFHSVKDVYKAHGFEGVFFNDPSLQAIISIRNGVHHSKEVVFESWNSRMYKTGKLSDYEGATFLLTGHKTVEGGDCLGEYYLPLMDLKRSKFYNKFEEGLSIGKMWDYASTNRYPEGQVYINMIPIVTAAATTLFSHLMEKDFIPKFFDSEVYISHFKRVHIDLGSIYIKPLKINIY